MSDSNEIIKMAHTYHTMQTNFDQFVINIEEVIKSLNSNPYGVNCFSNTKKDGAMFWFEFLNKTFRISFDLSHYSENNALLAKIKFEELKKDLNNKITAKKEWASININEQGHVIVPGKEACRVITGVSGARETFYIWLNEYVGKLKKNFTPAIDASRGGCAK
jgi:hypothetical protein